MIKFCTFLNVSNCKISFNLQVALRKIAANAAKAEGKNSAENKLQMFDWLL